MPLKVDGVAKLSVPFTVVLDVTEEEFEGLSDHQQDLLIENAIDWASETKNADTDDFDIWEYEETK